MKAPACTDKVIKSTTGGPMSAGERHTVVSNKSSATAPQYSGAAAGEASYERNSALNKTKAQNAVPGGDKAMTLQKSVLGQA